MIEGEPLASVLAGAAFVAAADLVSTIVGVAAAALPRNPLLDPPSPPPLTSSSERQAHGGLTPPG